jgi:hypothetical protein
LVTTGLLFAALTVAPTPAHAAGGGFVEGSADCPAGQHALGGGVSVIGQSSADFGTSVKESFPAGVAAARRWGTAVKNNDTVSHLLQFSVTCMNPLALSNYTVVRKQVRLLPRVFHRDFMACPIGRVALSGGFRVTDGASGVTTLHESGPAEGTASVWQVTLRNEDTVVHDIDVLAVCANRPNGYTVVTGTFTVVPGELLHKFRACPPGTDVLGGGTHVVGVGVGDFRTNVQQTAPAPFVVVTDPSFLPTSGWFAAVRNNDTAAHTIAVVATCANPPAGYQVVRREVVIA